jgi:hypothetical protein
MPLRDSIPLPPPAFGYPPSTSCSNDPLLSGRNMQSPTLSTSSAAHSSATRAFFGAITERVRGRSRSRSPAPTRSTQMSPPETAAKMQQPQQQPLQHSKPESPHPTISQSTTASSKTDRSSIGSVDKSQWDQMVYGRHSSDVGFVPLLPSHYTHTNNFQWLFKSQRTLKRQSTGSSISS